MAEFTNEKMEVTEDQLQDVSGGATDYDPGFFYTQRYKFDGNDVKALAKHGFKVQAGKEYSRSDLNNMGIPGSDAEEMKANLIKLGVKFVF